MRNVLVVIAVLFSSLSVAAQTPDTTSAAHKFMERQLAMITEMVDSGNVEGLEQIYRSIHVFPQEIQRAFVESFLAKEQLHPEIRGLQIAIITEDAELSKRVLETFAPPHDMNGRVKAEHAKTYAEKLGAIDYLFDRMMRNHANTPEMSAALTGIVGNYYMASHRPLIFKYVQNVELLESIFSVLEASLKVRGDAGVELTLTLLQRTLELNVNRYREYDLSRFYKELMASANGNRRFELNLILKAIQTNTMQEQLDGVNTFRNKRKMSCRRLFLVF